MVENPVTRPRIAAGATVFDSWDVALAAVTHLVNQGILDFYIVDHRSSGNPRDNFVRQVPASARIHWFRKESPYFSQGAITTALANLARQDGFDAFVPFDADEFFTGVNANLINVIEQWLATTTTRSLRCVMVNFLQSNDVTHFSAETLAQVHFRVETGDAPVENLVGRDQEFRRYPLSSKRYKAIMRLTSGADGDLDWLSNGNHHVLDMATGNRRPHTSTSEIEVFHLPYPSSQGLIARRGTALRQPSTGGVSLDPGSDENQMEATDNSEEWALASVPGDATEDSLVIGGVTVVRDERLSQLAPTIVAAIRPKTSTATAVSDETARVANVALDLAMTSLDVVALIKGRSRQMPTSESISRETMRSYRLLERRVVKLQAQVDSMRPNLFRLLLNRLRRR